MDTDTLITYILLFLFFVLPAILKRRKKKAAEKTKPVQASGKKTGFSGIGNALREFVKEMERQVQEAKAAERQTSGTPDRGSVWDLLDDREPETETAERASVGRRTDLDDVVSPAPMTRATPVADSPPARTKRPPKPVPTCIPRVRTALPASALQQAVVWSEILGPPKALRQG